MQMLSGYRCLDLCDEKGFFAGKLLGDLRADVIKIEKPGGDPSRLIGPFYDGRSAYWDTSNTNKRGITLDLEKEEGARIFLRLAAGSDVIIESFPPGYLDRLGLGYDSLKKVNNKIILTSITPFGETGAYRDFKTSDLVAMSMGGITWLIGDTDRPPLTVGFPQAYYFAGAYAALATLMALYSREANGEGQHVSTSVQQSVVPVTLNAVPHWTVNGSLVKRAGDRRAGLTSGAPQRQTWKCQDGYVTLTIYGGARGAKTNRPLVEWMSEEGAAPDYLKEKDWTAFDVSKTTPQDWELIEAPICQFFLRHTKTELYREAMNRGIMLFPVYGFSDLLADPQLEARQYWNKVKIDESHSAVYPGAFAKVSETPIEMRRLSPGIGEHNREVLGELGITEEELQRLKRSGVV